MKWSSWVVIFFIQFIGWKLLFRNQNFVAFWYENITQNYNQIIYNLTSKINFPIGEIVYTLLIIGLVYLLFVILRKKSKTEKISLLFKVFSIVLFIYNSLWGVVNYKENFNINNDKLKVEVNDLKLLYYNNLEELNILREELKINEKGTIDFTYNNDVYLKDVSQNLKKLEKESWINEIILPEKLVVKESIFSTLLSYSGVLGYYNPFTIESNINSNNSDLKTPFTISHELAHQLGFATENEANFIAYYLGVNSSNPEIKYAAHFKTTFSLLNAIYRHDSIFVKNELDNLPKGIKLDREAEKEYYKKYDGKLNDWFSNINDQFLKANNQEGIVSYSKYIELVVYYNSMQNKKANQ
ncbi:DUF3810 domain-containing protein [Faecalibacter bovis]|uniref:DUF3810 domain-containing protein n=1 Tax=Faecalibacter bovis TaxID=2898187 RepID=A0ABX7XC59_9FLAO|nr:DUF3810 domain-containing protein [Faecalibacter bovis]QTV05404.1 DUF3810 domain-containing protein [Faecalibacter bovis]